jgi:hypothetical protein
MPSFAIVSVAVPTAISKIHWTSYALNNPNIFIVNNRILIQSLIEKNTLFGNNFFRQATVINI